MQSVNVGEKFLILVTRFELHRIDFNLNLVFDNLANCFADRSFKVFCTDESKVKFDRFRQDRVASEQDRRASVEAVVVVDFEVGETEKSRNKETLGLIDSK